ncbi:sensor domain-containing protein [Bacillus sp. USDA818B3_A]|uniref:sensor domain-containing protein n=1 Tax=Bacillus sp. USDA818B3_A TaxID=2698834 RepID=UPI00136F451E|nr:GGDEF domain-containing protein [Bacillus sp. USDA818B3_A]
MTTDNLDFLNKDLFFKLFNNMSDLVYLTKVRDDSQFTYVLANEPAKKFSRITSEAYGKPVSEVLPPEVYQVIKDKYFQVLSTKKPVKYEDKFILATPRDHSNNHIVYWESTVTPVVNQEGECTHLLAVVRDVTERKKYEKQLEHLAHHDNLTGLPNRTYFFQKLKEEMELSKQTHTSLAVFYLDVDHFKEINDTLGHDIGDELLKEFTKRIKTCIREEDMFARLGGDEFVILLTGLSDENIIEIAKRILTSVKRTWTVNNHRINISTSIGIAFYSHLNHDEKSLLKHADNALYQAKKNGRGSFSLYKN